MPVVWAEWVRLWARWPKGEPAPGGYRHAEEGKVREVWHYIVIGFGFGIGFTVGQWALNALLGLLGQGAQRKGP